MQTTTTTPHTFNAHPGIEVGDRVRSFDSSYPERRVLEGELANYVEGIVVDIIEVEGCNRYKIAVTADVFRGEELEGEAARKFVTPPVNGTPTTLGNITDGVELIARAATVKAVAAKVREHGGETNIDGKLSGVDLAIARFDAALEELEARPVRPGYVRVELEPIPADPRPDAWLEDTLTDPAFAGILADHYARAIEGDATTFELDRWLEVAGRIGRLWVKAFGHWYPAVLVEVIRGKAVVTYTTGTGVERAKRVKPTELALGERPAGVRGRV